jgi:hypothetical protein
MDAIDENLVNMVKVRPRRQVELCNASSLSVQATLYRLQKLEIKNIIWAERDNPQHSVIYHLAADLEKEKEVEFGVPLKDDLPTVKGGNDARIQE